MGVPLTGSGETTIDTSDGDGGRGIPMTAPRPPAAPQWVEWLALASLALLVCCFLALSWRKWPDPQIDFGRELYIPWRLSLGDVLGRDIEPQYGPLSQFFNARLFALFGPSLMLLVRANLVVYAVILFGVYGILRQGWGVLGAWAGSVVFVSVFSFSQFDIIGNYNYMTPYAHEATHGLLVCVLLTTVLISFLRQPGLGKCALAGFLLGLSAVLKAEIMFAASAVAGMAAILHWSQWSRRAALRMGSVFLLAAMLPSLAFFAYFSRHLGPEAAFLSTGRAWLNVVATDRFASELPQQQFSGLDEPLANLADQVFAVGIGIAIVGSMLLAVRLAERNGYATGPGWMRWALIVGMAAIGSLASHYVVWPSVGQALLGMSMLGPLINLWQYGSRGDLHGIGELRLGTAARILAGTLAVALMARMLLNGRIQHYGFFQAALAGTVVAAAMVSEWPARLTLTRYGQMAAAAGMMGLIAGGIAALIPVSAHLLDAKRLEVGSGPDLFYAFPPRLWPSGELIRAATQYLSRSEPGARILVLPEGVMINYLLRRPTPTASYRFFASDLAEGREERLVEELKKSPPQQIVLLSRDLQEYGISRYGVKKGEGRAILQWIARDYELAAHAGGDPLDPRQAGVAIYRQRPRSAE